MLIKSRSVFYQYIELEFSLKQFKFLNLYFQLKYNFLHVDCNNCTEYIKINFLGVIFLILRHKEMRWEQTVKYFVLNDSISYWNILVKSFQLDSYISGPGRLELLDVKGFNFSINRYLDKNINQLM